MTACEMYVEDPYPFAWCETHDETFPLGETCPFNSTVGGVGDQRG